MSSSTLENPRLANILWFVAGVLMFWSFGYTVMRGSDLWWHIAGGRWMVENGTLWVREPFGFTAEGRWWLNDAWLSDVGLWLWTAAFGVETLAFWKWLLIIATWLVLFRTVSRVCEDRTSAFIAVTFGLAVAAPFLDVRPQLYSFLGFALLIELTWKRRPPMWLPVVFFFWVNFHAGFLLGLIVLPALLFPWFWNEPKERTRLVMLAGLCAAACAINPNGIEVILRPLRYAFDDSSPFRQLGEWLPPHKPGGIRSWLFDYATWIFGGTSLCAVVYAVRDRRRVDWWLLVAVAVGALTLVMSLRSRRFIPFFSMAQSLVVGWALAMVLRKVTKLIPSVIPPVVGAVVGLFWLWPFPQSTVAFDFLTARYEFPIETLNFIEKNQISGRMFAYYNWGGYIHLRTGGRVKVFIDGRAGTVYEDETFRQYMTVLQNKPGWQRIVEETDAKYVLWPSNVGNTVQALFKSGKWRLIYQDYKSALFIRADQPTVPYAHTPDSAYRRLALGWQNMHAGEPEVAAAHYKKALEFLPHLTHACANLARVQLMLGRRDDGWRTLEGCNEKWPDPKRIEWFHRVNAQYDIEQARKN